MPKYANCAAGTLPEKWGQMQSLISLDLSLNRLTGDAHAITICKRTTMSRNARAPSSHCSTALSYKDGQSVLSVKFCCAGSLPEMWDQLQSLQFLDLDTNQLSGDALVVFICT